MKRAILSPRYTTKWGEILRVKTSSTPSFENKVKRDMKGTKTLATILIPFFLTAIGFSFLKLYNIWESTNNIQQEIAEYQFRLFKLRRVADRMEILENTIDRLSNRLDNIESINTKLSKNLELSKSDIDEWNLKIVNYLLELGEDYGKLQQFDSENYPILSRAAIPFTEVLSNEKKVLHSLQRLLDVYGNANASITEREEFYQKFSDALIEFSQSINIYESLLDGVKDEVETYDHKETLESNKLSMKISSLKYTFYIFIVLGSISVIIVFLLSLIVLGFQISKKK